MKFRWLGSIATASAMGVIAAPALAADETRLRAAFAAADTNADGVVNVDEYVAYFVEAFRDLDDDGKGYLVQADFRQFDPARFASADRDGDGRITLGEAVAERMTLFFELADSDGVITLEELLAYENSR